MDAGGSWWAVQGLNLRLMRVNPILESSINVHERPRTATDAGLREIVDSTTVHGRSLLSAG